MNIETILFVVRQRTRWYYSLYIKKWVSTFLLIMKAPIVRLILTLLPSLSLLIGMLWWCFTDTSALEMQTITPGKFSAEMRLIFIERTENE